MLSDEVMNMTWTQKETSLLKDLKDQEQLCVDKYAEYAKRAHDPELKQLFEDIRQTEQQHLTTVCTWLGEGTPNAGNLAGRTAAQGLGRRGRAVPRCKQVC